MRIIIILLLVVMAFSCKTVKEVVKVETKYDSTAINENKQLRLFLSEEIERFEKEREAWENTGVTFFRDNVVAGTDTTGKINWTTKASDPPYTVHAYTPPTKIIFENGKIKSVEGPIKSIDQSRYQKKSELSESKKKIDSLIKEDEKNKVELSKKQSVVVKEKKVTVTPWWIWLLLAVGWIGRGYWPRLKNIIIKKGAVKPH